MNSLTSSTSEIAISAYDDSDTDDLYCDARDYEPDLHWNYAAKGVLCRGETSVLYGPSNCGKSALVCHLGHCIVTGNRFFESKVTKGAVIHVCAEAPRSVKERVFAYQDDDTAAPYFVRRKGVDLSQPTQVEKFVFELKRIAETCPHEVVLVVIDTLARSIGDLDENCSSSMTRVAETAEHIAAELNAHVMLVHHTGKDAERGGRGSSALRGAVFTELSLRPDDNLVVLAQEKQRTLEKASPVQFKIVPVVLGKDEDGEDRTTVHVAEIAGEVDCLRKSGRQREGSTCDAAVLTALHIRRMMGKRSAEPFRPLEIVDTLPSEVFGNIAKESRVRRVTRVLEKLASQGKPLVEKVDQGWCLAPPRSDGPTDRK